MSVTLRRTGDAALWDLLARSRPGATAFFDWTFLDLAESLLPVRVERLLVLDGGEPVGVFPVARRLTHWPPDSPNLPFPFVGPLVRPSLLAPAVAALRRRQLVDGLLLARFDIAPSLVDESVTSSLRSAGAVVVEDSTVAVDLSHGSLDQLHAGFARMRRKNVRRALASGTVVRAARPGELDAVLPTVLDEAYAVHGIGSPYPASVGAQVEAWAAGRPEVTCWVASVGDELAGALVMLGGHPTAIAWIGGCLRRFRDESPNALLHQTVLDAALEGGHTALDFSGWVDDAVGSYKLGFGGERRPYLSVKISPVPRALIGAAKRLRG